MHLILGIVFPLAPLVILRGQAREKKGIEVADYKHPLSCVLRGFYIASPSTVPAGRDGGGLPDRLLLPTVRPHTAV